MPHPKTPNALHSHASPRWGTPSHILDAARRALVSPIDLDPASSQEFNRLVGAKYVLTEDDNGLTTPWPDVSTVLLNPPGGLVKPFWDRLVTYLLAHPTSRAIWVGFSVEQLCTLTGRQAHPLDFPTCLLRKRLSFTRPDGSTFGSPTHGNYITGLNVPPALFRSVFDPLGYVTCVSV